MRINLKVVAISGLLGALAFVPSADAAFEGGSGSLAWCSPRPSPSTNYNFIVHAEAGVSGDVEDLGTYQAEAEVTFGPGGSTPSKVAAQDTGHWLSQNEAEVAVSSGYLVVPAFYAGTARGSASAFSVNPLVAAPVSYTTDASVTCTGETTIKDEDEAGKGFASVHCLAASASTATSFQMTGQMMYSANGQTIDGRTINHFFTGSVDGTPKLYALMNGPTFGCLLPDFAVEVASLPTDSLELMSLTYSVVETAGAISLNMHSVTYNDAGPGGPGSLVESLNTL